MSGPHPIAVRNPRTGEADYSITPPTADAIAALARRLRAAQPAWRALGPEARGAVLLRWAQALLAHTDALTAALTTDTGRAGISRIEVLGIQGLIARWVKDAPKLIAAGEASGQATSIPTITTSTRLVPYALAGVISPWNFPLTLSLIDAIPALMAGCAVLIKPSEVTPRFAAPLAASIAAVPELAAVLAIITGAGETGQDLVDAVDVVCFTGSVATGRKVGERCARNFIPAFLELGGKDPMLVLKSADPVQAAKTALRASVVNSGQACQSIERIYVDEAIAEPFLAALVSEAKAAELNAQDIHHGHLGPIIFDKQAAILNAQLADARAKGAAVLTGGEIERPGGGAWLRPTVLSNVSHDMLVMTEETFGPILPVMTFKTIDEAVELANFGVYGLSAAVLAGSADEAEAVAERIEAGAVSINDGSLTSMVWEAEKSSFKLSGLGASRMGASGLLRFFRKQALIRQSGTPAPLDAYAEQALTKR
jgi:succinate-semialdehyde dehydrogenase / glutarate-semialdehyde dehydrogenase